MTLKAHMALQKLSKRLVFSGTEKMRRFITVFLDTINSSLWQKQILFFEIHYYLSLTFRSGDQC
jgi:hypothetical protein